MDIEQDLQNKIKEFELNEKVNLARGESVKWHLFFFYPFRLFRSNKVMKENTRLSPKEAKRLLNKMNREKGYFVNDPNGEYYPLISNVAKEKRKAKKRRNKKRRN